MFLRNAWYVIADSEEVTNTPLARVVLNEPLVLWRLDDGLPVALEDRCCHRQAPLSAGKIHGNNIQCGYHGLVFDPDGECIEVPSQDRVPPNARVKKYPLYEKYGWVWAWMGDPLKKDLTLIPDTFWHKSDQWLAVADKFYVHSNYQYLIDIQLDNTHSRFVHPDTLGNAGSLRHSPKVERVGETIHNTREMRDSDPPPYMVNATGHTGNADVWVAWTYYPRAGLITFDTGIAELEGGIFEGNDCTSYKVFNTHGITPETVNTTHHFWVSSRNFSLTDERVTGVLSGIRETFLEDVDMVEAQHKILTALPDRNRVDVNADQPTIQARNLMEKLMRKEQSL